MRVSERRQDAGHLAGLCFLVLLVAAAADAPSPLPLAGHSLSTSSPDELQLGVVPEDGLSIYARYGSGSSGAVESGLAALAVLTVQEAGSRARAVPSLAKCAPNATADAPDCLHAVLRALRRGELTAAILPVGPDEAPPSWQLRAAGLDQLGEVAPPTRRSCLASLPPVRSLLDLATPSLATQYALPADFLPLTKNITFFVPEWCKEVNSTCASLLTSDVGEAETLAAVVSRSRLYGQVVVLGERLAEAWARAIAAGRPALACDFAPELWLPAQGPGRPLGPPPCASPDPCPFETRRLLTYANVRLLARSPAAHRALVRLAVTGTELRALADGGPSAAPGCAAALAVTAGARVEVRVAVMAHDGVAAGAAAALAEARLEAAQLPRGARLKAEVYAGGCAAGDAYKYLLDAVGGGEFGALSAVAGPACGAAFADISRSLAPLALPVLAYTPQPVPAGAAHGLVVLGAGSTGAVADALAALFAAYGWRRVAALTEAGTRAQLDPARLRVDLVAHLELPDDAPSLDYQFVTEWVKRVVSARGHIVLVLAERAQTVRAVLCAGGAAGLRPVWVLPGTLLPDWHHPSPTDTHACTAETLLQLADGHLVVMPEWAAQWHGGVAHPSWSSEWRVHCRENARAGGATFFDCTQPPASAALLYDLLWMWSRALDALLVTHPGAAEDLHDASIARTMLANVTNTNYTGITGRFKWVEEEGAWSRLAPLVVLQWQNGTVVEVGRWEGGALALRVGALMWPGNVTPQDGAEYCDIQPLADLLAIQCRSAYFALGGVLLVTLTVVLGFAALVCRRRLERRYRTRLAALHLRPLAPRPAAPDRWELPRDRLVINRKLGVGAFGTVYGGHALLADGRRWSAVAVKTLKCGAADDQKLEFLSEAETMKRFDHKNVVRLLGVVTRTEPVCTVMEFMQYGDLKSYLVARRHLAGGDSGEVSARRLTAMALDVANALAYLARLRYVHRDVAARNCLVAADRTVKLGDYGMTRLISESDYYRFSRRGLLPVRWMAPESLAMGKFSPASDVWSFGVLLYEIVTFGALPYQGMSNPEVLAYVKAGGTLTMPIGIKPRLETVMSLCWCREARSRPRAPALAAALAACPRLLAPVPDTPDAVAPPVVRRTPVPPDICVTPSQRRWVSWGAPPSASTDTTYVSAALADPDADTDVDADVDSNTEPDLDVSANGDVDVDENSDAETDSFLP